MKSSKWSALRSLVARLPRYAGRTVGLLVLLASGWFLRGACAPAHEAPAGASPEHAEHAGAEPEAAAPEVVWSCSMDPQVQQPGPGPCPICGMDLIPVTREAAAGLRQVSVTPEAAALMRVETAPVERRFPEAQVRLVGILSHDETRRRYVTNYVPGWTERLYVDYVGVEVRAGDHLVELYSPQLLGAQQELLEARRTLDALGESSLPSIAESTRHTLEEGRRRLGRWGMTPAQIDELLATGVTSDRTTVYAQRGGIVTEKLVEEGAFVEEGVRIYSLDDLSQLWLRLEAYESDLAWLHYGQRVAFETEAYPGESFDGTIAFIAPELEPRTRTVSVRVNVPNPDRRLKPGMFVRAVVRSRLAGVGRLMDPELAGKWICPMHPEVVKSGQEPCDLCGMDLVTTESLGYVAADSAGIEPPLVIPVTAALRTGTRAVVYVLQPDQEQPTFEGREVLLGSRAGDSYIVRNGLAEGELVVTHGSFKIDSALQLQAKPSMMSPGGGGGSGVHRHGGGAPQPEAGGGESGAEHAELAAGLRFRLERLQRRELELERALEAGDLAGARAACAGLGADLAAIEEAQIPAETRAVWRELAMRLSNDAVEGRAARDLARLRSLRAGIAERLGHLRATFGLEAQPRHAEAGLQTPAALRGILAAVWERYAALARALADDEEPRARAELARLRELTPSFDAGLPPDAGARWSPIAERLAAALDEASGTPDVAQLRAAFAKVHAAVDEALTTFGVPGAAPVYRVHCPMAFQGEGGDWLSPDAEVRNPYYGALMYACGEVVGAIEPRGGER